MQTMKRLAAPVSVLACLAVLLGACAAPTPYRPALKGEGFSDRPIEDGRFRISFAGNETTPRATVEDYMLYRAAEVTLANGKDHFVVVQRNVEERARTVVRTEPDPMVYGWTGFRQPLFTPHYARHPRNYYWTADPFSPFPPAYPRTKTRETIVSYDAHAEIALGSGAKPAGDKNAYDARAVIAEIGPRVVRPET